MDSQILRDLKAYVEAEFKEPFGKADLLILLIVLVLATQSKVIMPTLSQGEIFLYTVMVLVLVAYFSVGRLGNSPRMRRRKTISELPYK